MIRHDNIADINAAFTRNFHNKILTIDDTSDLNEVNKLPVANEHGYLDNSWLQDYSSYKIVTPDEPLTSDYTTSLNETEYVNVLTIGADISIMLFGASKNTPYNRALVYRFLIFNPQGHTVEWISNVENSTIVWNTYSESAPELDVNGTYLEFMSVDDGLTWFGTSANMTDYDIHDYYPKTESDNRFVNVTGDTMTGTLKLSGAHNMASKRAIFISGDNQSHAVAIQDTGLTKGVAPTGSNRVIEGFVTFGSEMNNGASNKVGAVYNQILTTNKNSMIMEVFNLSNSTSTDRNYISVSIDPDGTKSSYSFTPATDDNSNNIATTAYVKNQNLVPAMDSNTVGRYLSNNGTTSEWIDYKKLQWIYRATGETFSVTVPAGYRENAVITDVYRDGVLLTESDDYTINVATGVISFNDTLHSGERVIVVTESAVKANTHPVYDNITITNSTADTPDTSDNSSKIATTAYVNSLISSLNIGSGGGSGGEFTLDSPRFTGTPTAPTANINNNSTQIATTAFVKNVVNSQMSSILTTDSPQLEGIPTAPTAAAGTSTTQIATTAFVKTAIDNVVGPAPADLNTLAELAASIGNDPNFAATMTSALNAKINTGLTQTGSGNAVTSVTELNGNITVTKGSTFSLANHNHDSVYFKLPGTVGSGINPVYSINDVLTASTSSVGTNTKPIYMLNGTITETNATIGDDITPIHMTDGELVATTTTVGSDDTPVYLSGGSITSTGKNFSDYLPLTGGTISGNIVFEDNSNNKRITINGNGINATESGNATDLKLNSSGGAVTLGNEDTGVVSIENGIVTATTFVGNIGGTSEKASMDALGNIIDQTYAPLASPEFSGTPTAPTAVAGDNSDQIATTAYVDTAVSNLINSAPEALDTLAELSAALGDDENFAANITSSIAEKLDADSPDYIKSLSLTGTTLTYTTGDDTSVELTTQDTTYTAGNGIDISNENVISITSALPDQENNAGKFLTTDGTTASWSDELLTELKVSSIHYPNENDTFIILSSEQDIPSDVTKYTLAVYRDGVYLNPTIDYGYNHASSTLSFSKPFEADEIVTVLFTYIGTDTQQTFDIDIDKYEAGDGIIFTENPVNNVTTISAVPTDTSGFITSEMLLNYAPIASPDFTGSPSATTPATTANNTRIATTRYVNNRLASPIEKVTVIEPSDEIEIAPEESPIFTVTLDQDCSISIAEITNKYYTVNGSVITLIIPSTTYIVTWANNIVWVKGEAPDLYNGDNIISFITADDGVTWYGNVLSVES